MEWIPIVVSIVSAAVAVVGAYRSAQAAQRATAAERKRADGRATLARAIDAINRLLEELYRERNANQHIGEEDARILAAVEAGHRAVEEADPSQLPRYHEPIKNLTAIHALEERRRRLQEIQDRL